MHMTKRLALAASLLFLVGASQVLADPFLWLEERNGEKAMAWVAEQNARTSAELRGDPRYDPYVDTAFELFTSSDNPAYGYVQGGLVYNFWQDDEHNLGLWRRTSPASYKTRRARLGDGDRLRCAGGGRGHELGLFSCRLPGAGLSALPDRHVAGRRRRAGVPRVRPCLQELREGRLLLAGLQIGAELARCRHADPDAGLRREPADQLRLFAAGEVVEARHAVGAGRDGASRPGSTISRPMRMSRSDGAFADLVLGRSIDFYSSEAFVRLANGEMRQVPLPLDAIIQQHFDGQLVFSLRSPWQAPDGKTYAAGGVYSFDFQDWLKSGSIAAIDTLLEPSPRAAVLSTARTKAKLYRLADRQCARPHPRFRAHWRQMAIAARSHFPTMATSRSTTPIWTAHPSRSAIPIS